MSKKAVTVYCWKAVHTSGTKFYQVIRFISANNRSLSIRQNGLKELFTGLGKMSTATIALDENLPISSDAGIEKIRAKGKDGYVQEVQETSVKFHTVRDATTWVRERFGSKAQDLTLRVLRSPEWQCEQPPEPMPPWETPAAPKQPDELDSVKHPDWGSW